MKILITGSNGQLGKACLEILGSSAVGFDKTHLDITNIESASNIIRKEKPTHIIHCAAYTNVKNAETDALACYKTNIIGTYNIASIAKELSVKLIYISTDFVFDGKSSTPYTEKQLTNPQTVYGKSKLSGEYLVADISNDNLIVRTSWVFGDGKNFVNTMLKLSETNSELNIVDDQIGSPTYTRDLAFWIKILIEQKASGVFHASNSNTCSWADFAQKIFEVTNKNVNINKLSTMEYQERFDDTTPRPHYSALALEKLAFYGIKPRPWTDALQEFLKKE
jgi:dTDP-4-dehydrorhamnose reductase